jgi:hypothetical protein
VALSVAFQHESFWVATSAVAPVVALAAVVALPDATLIGRANNVLQRLKEDQPPRDAELHNFLAGAARDMRKWAGIAWLITLANLIIQAGLLVVSLCALALRQDVMSFWLAIGLATSGIVLLAVCTMVSASQRWTLEGGLFREGGAADSYLTPQKSADSGH